jgi:hypothetical protein
MTLLTYILNANGTVDWWTTTAAARDFWLAFVGIGIVAWAALALRARSNGRPRVRSSHR